MDVEAKLYHAQGCYAEAELLGKRALAVDKKALGPDHPTLPPSYPRGMLRRLPNKLKMPDHAYRAA
jgi:Tetratricopeptide repeat